jgi:hypothetical protein
MEKIKRDPMEMYNSRPTAKIIKQVEIKQSEWSHQLVFCKWLKNQYPNIKFRSDIQSAGKLTPQMQNIKCIIDPFRGWPDIAIYHAVGNYCGLQIELKRLDSGLYLKNGLLSNSKHVQEQNEFHIFLRKNNWKVEFAEGAEQAKRIFVSYINNL